MAHDVRKQNRHDKLAMDEKQSPIRIAITFKYSPNMSEMNCEGLVKLGHRS
jgi:hypothetical protein